MKPEEKYKIDIFIFNIHFTVKRTITVTAPSQGNNITLPNVTYTSTQQVTDFGSNQATIYCKIYQMSSGWEGTPWTGTI